jgi:hypothetical protein
LTVNPRVVGITGLVPASVVYGAGPQSVTINGSNFVLGARITVGSLSGLTVTGTIASATTPFVYVSSTQLKFWWSSVVGSVGYLATGSHNVTVTNQDLCAGSATITGGFTVTGPQPTITSINTTVIPPVYGVTASQQVYLNGTNFFVGAVITVGNLNPLGLATVTGSNATAAVPYVYIDDGTRTHLRFWWPNTSLAPGAYTVRVANPAAAGGGTATGVFTVAAPQPTITSINPASVVYGVTGSQEVYVNGTNFVVGATIRVSSPTTTTFLQGDAVAGSAASATTPYVYMSSMNGNQLKFWWPNTSLNAVAYTVQVTNPTIAGGLLVSRAAGFTVTMQPTISSVTPNLVTRGVTSSQSITITGTRFLVGATITLRGPNPSTTVALSGTTVSGAAATATVPYVFTSSTQVKFWWLNTTSLPALPAGTYNVIVTNPDASGGLSATLGGGFVVN